MSLKLLIALGFLDGFLPPPCVRFQTPCSKCEKKCTTYYCRFWHHCFLMKTVFKEQKKNNVESLMAVCNGF